MSTVAKIVATVLSVAVAVAAVVLRHSWWPPLLQWAQRNGDTIKAFAGLTTILVAAVGLIGFFVRRAAKRKDAVQSSGSSSAGHRSAHVHISGTLTDSPTTTNVFNAPVSVEATRPRANVEEEIRHRTDQFLTHSRIKITGMESSIPRIEIDRIEEQLALRRPVALTGDGGSGKSGIGVKTIQRARDEGKVVLVLDARRLKYIQHERDLRKEFGADKPLISVFRQVANNRGFRLVIDQLDNVIGLPVAAVLTDIAIECAVLDNFEVVVICRKKETREARLLERLFSSGFVELESRELDNAGVKQALESLGISSPSLELISRCRNLLNLEIVASIKIEEPDFDFDEMLGEVEIWNAYLKALQQREEDGATLEEAESTMREAVRLATEALRTGEQIFLLDDPPLPRHRRLISWQMIIREDGRFYRFKHEKLQDFLYAKDAADRGLMPPAVMGEITLLRSRNILLWMNKIYADRQSPRRLEFARAMLTDQN